MSTVTLTPVTPDEYLEPGYYLTRLEFRRGNPLNLTYRDLEGPLKEQYGDRVDLIAYTPSTSKREAQIQIRVNPLNANDQLSAAAVPVPLIWLAGVCVVMLAGYGISYNFKDAFRIDSEDIGEAVKELTDSFETPGGQFASLATSSALVIAAVALLVWVWPKS